MAGAGEQVKGRKGSSPEGVQSPKDTSPSQFQRHLNPAATGHRHGGTSRRSSVAIVARTLMREDMSDRAMPTMTEEENQDRNQDQDQDGKFNNVFEETDEAVGIVPSTPEGSHPRTMTPMARSGGKGRIQVGDSGSGDADPSGFALAVTEQVLRAKAHADMRGMGPVRMAQLSPRAPRQMGAEALELPQLDDMPRHYKTVLNAVTHPSHRLLELSDGL